MVNGLDRGDGKQKTNKENYGLDICLISHPNTEFLIQIYVQTKN